VTRAVVVRYRVKPHSLADNAALVRAVYDELASTEPEGLRYSTHRVDELTFVHVAIIEGTTNPLDDVAASRAFTEGIAVRCEEPPQVAHGELLGSYPATSPKIEVV
jgi:hypothetical protein